MSTTYETLLLDITDGVALVTVNRPEVRNAVSRQVLADLRSVLADLRDDDDAGVVVFTGAGEKAFVAGADISQLQHYTLHTALASEMQRVYDEIEAFEAYFRAQGLFGVPQAGDIAYTKVVRLDLGTVAPSLAGPKRPQDRVPLVGGRALEGEGGCGPAQHGWIQGG